MTLRIFDITKPGMLITPCDKAGCGLTASAQYDDGVKWFLRCGYHDPTSSVFLRGGYVRREWAE